MGRRVQQEQGSPKCYCNHRHACMGNGGENLYNSEREENAFHQSQHNDPPKPKQLQMYRQALGHRHSHNKAIHADFAEAS